ncbi:hypothetical protein SBC1_21270 [Caballeronia sp. SBC1]|nr:hypothetical protein SBC2_22650 [Caballeronia sp. SBC2]QIN62129.1 hypothetical protein SBC1_21270 [Caballeronia sp. SBC1]
MPHCASLAASDERRSARHTLHATGEACPLGPVHQIQELIRTHVNQFFMIAGLEIDVRLTGEALVKIGLHAIGRTYRRKRPHLAILEQLTQIELFGQLQTAPGLGP